MKNRWSSEARTELAQVLVSRERGRTKSIFAQRISPYVERKKFFPFSKNNYSKKEK